MDNNPIPGSRADNEGARQFIRITVQGNTLDFVPNLTMQEKFTVRAQTSLPFEAFLPTVSETQVGEDTLFILWWLARRQNGEPQLPLKQAEGQWPTEFKDGDLDMVLIDLDDDLGAADSGES